ncbi:NAK protein kinase [Plasmodium inui San Antonio 1]|uniref:non-specific serine/threonine protein kinase n=1 Tax=Plasmodium inui San Antonio 1 TaxID=1237626 RepID=W7A6Y8_9APIC|nr:NAK protein kinase [Plasmodium inui San Antonio 1]EUD64864.1 NAK protein kinase [Plasmodium inui San Antonio 1]
MLKLRSICTTLIGGKVYNINGKTIREEKLLSEGAYSFVYLAKDLNTNKEYTIKKTICQDKEKLQMAQKEIHILKSLPPHKNIVQYFGSTIISENGNKIVIMLMEFCERGNLLTIFEKNKDKIKENHIVKILKDIVKGLHFLHTQEIPIIHRDIKLENILCDKNGIYKICDFCSHSVSNAFFPNDLTKNALNVLKEEIERDTTFMYRPPELIDLYANREISSKVDLWMVGCILYLLLFKVHPFQNHQNSFLSIINGSFIIPYHSKYSKRIISILLMTLNKNPQERLDSTTLLFILENYAELKIWFNHIPSDVRKMVNQIFEKISELNLNNKQNEMIEISNGRILDVKISSQKYETQVQKSSAPSPFFRFFAPSAVAQDPFGRKPPGGVSSDVGSSVNNGVINGVSSKPHGSSKLDSDEKQPDGTATQPDSCASQPDAAIAQANSTIKEAQLISIGSAESVGDPVGATQKGLNVDFLNLNGDAVQGEGQPEGGVKDSSCENRSLVKNITLDSEMRMFGFDSGFGSGAECRSEHGREGADAVAKQGVIPVATPATSQVSNGAANLSAGLHADPSQGQIDFNEFFDPWSASKGDKRPVAPTGKAAQDGHPEGTQYDLFEKDVAHFKDSTFKDATFFKDATNNEPFKYTPSLDEMNVTRKGADVTNETLYKVNHYDDLDNVEDCFPTYDEVNFGKKVDVSFSTNADVFSGAPKDPSGKFIASDKNDKFSELLEEFQKCSI